MAKVGPGEPPLTREVPREAVLTEKSGVRIAVEEAEWWLRNEAGAEGAGPMLGIGWALVAIARALEEQR